MNYYEASTHLCPSILDGCGLKQVVMTLVFLEKHMVGKVGDVMAFQMLQCFMPCADKRKNAFFAQTILLFLRGIFFDDLFF